MKPYLTILLDSFRMLKAKAIFWVTLGISLLVALIYLSIGFGEEGMSFFFGLWEIEDGFFVEGSSKSASLYVAIFTKLIAEYWLSWIAVLLALISCSAIYPEALKEGAAGMVLTKKPSRLGVFVAKFVGSLLFVAIQVTLFVVIVFIALKWRLGSWNPSIFWYVPLILLVFTYLYSFMTLVAVKIKSPMTALILTLGLWFVSSIVGVIEGAIYQQMKLTELRDDSGEASESTWHKRLVTAYSIFPKTGRTLDVGDRLLEINGEKGIAKGDFLTVLGRLTFEDNGKDDDEFKMSPEELAISENLADRHSTTYVIGTSLAFSFVMLSLAGWIFCRAEI